VLQAAEGLALQAVLDVNIQEENELFSL
jgi:hypothetical protein